MQTFQRLIREAIAAAEPMRDMGDGRGSFLIDELTKQLTEAGWRRARKASGASVGRFEDFWKVYPRKVNKAGSIRIWASKNLDSCADEIIRHVTVQAESVDWIKSGGAYVPHASTYLNQRRWEDDVAKPSIFDGAL